jgi:hypothetical protein
MRDTFWLFLLMGCGPRGVATDGTLDAGGDADADADADSDADTDIDTGLPGVDCGANPPTPGPWDQHPITVAGASARSAPYDHDAGMGPLLAATVGADFAVVDLPVSGAIITAVDFNGPATTASFWFEDLNGPMYAHELEVPVDPDSLHAGDAISFTATEVNDFYDTLEVTAVTGFVVDSTGNEVHVVDGMTGAPLSWDEHGMHVVEIWGGPLGAPVDCGASCYDLDYGADVVTFRSSSSFLYPGDCIHWIGPVGQFKATLQLDSSDYDWVWAY